MFLHSFVRSFIHSLLTSIPFILFHSMPLLAISPHSIPFHPGLAGGGGAAQEVHPQLQGFHRDGLLKGASGGRWWEGWHPAVGEAAVFGWGLFLLVVCLFCSTYPVEPGLPGRKRGNMEVKITGVGGYKNSRCRAKTIEHPTEIQRRSSKRGTAGDSSMGESFLSVPNWFGLGPNRSS